MTAIFHLQFLKSSKFYQLVRFGVPNFMLISQTSDYVHVHIHYMLSPVRLSSVMFVRPAQPVEVFGNFSTPFGTLAIC